jgi:hypothetical protein
MTDAADPQAGDATEVVGTASYWHHEAEFLAARRAMQIARGLPTNVWWRLTMVLFAHLLVLLGLLGLGMAVGQGEGSGLILTAFFGLPGLVFAHRWGYGRRRRLRKEFADSPTAGLKVDLTFTPGRLIAHTPNLDGSYEWRAFPAVVELRDGFVLKAGTRTGVWIPVHALKGIDAPGLAAFLRSKVARYRVTRRTARISE